MKNIIETTEHGLIEKRTGRKIISPLDSLVVTFFILDSHMKGDSQYEQDNAG